MANYERIGSLTQEKKQAKRKARQLHYTLYFPDLEDRIDCARNVTEVHNILTSARKLID